MTSRLQATVLGAVSVTSESGLAQTLVLSLAHHPVALARIWLARSDGLHLAGSAGVPTGGGSYSRLDGTFSRIAIGNGKIGQIAASRAPRVVLSLRGDEDWLANPEWIARQGVRAFVGHPLATDHEVLGVLAIFSRTRPSDEGLADWAFLAHFTAARLVDLRDREALQAHVAALDTIVTEKSSSTSPPVTTTTSAPTRIVTRGELRAFERDTLEAALRETAGRVFGPRGAAAMLRMKPTTLASRMTALGIPPARAIKRALK